jgi:hypothetical protein
MNKQAFDIEVIWGLSWVRGACLVSCRGLTHAGAIQDADRVLRLAGAKVWRREGCMRERQLINNW